MESKGLAAATPPWRALAAIALAATLLRLGLVLSYRTHEFHYPGVVHCPDELTLLRTGATCLDPDQYLRLGRSILSDKRFWLDGQPNTFRTPGYPLLVALTGVNISSLMLVQCILGGLTVLLLGVTGTRVAGRLAGLVAAGLQALDVSALLHTGMVMSESLFTVLLVLGLWLYLRRSILPSALVLGAAVLVRPVGAVVFAPLLLHLAGQRRWLLTGMFALGFAVLPGGWVLRNWYHYRHPTLATAGAYNTFNSAADVLARSRGVDYQALRDSVVERIEAVVPQCNPPALAAALERAAFDIALREPTRTILKWFSGMPRLMFSFKADDIVIRLGDERAGTCRVRDFLRSGANRSTRIAIWLLAAWELFALLGSCVLAAYALLRRGGGAWQVLLVGIAFCLVAAASPLVDGRYRDPVMPALYLLAGAGLSAIVSDGGSARRRTQSPAA
jgi:4-amino-4-deoxy-L-arabinose transferase-like glycosyltransferase